MYAISGHKPSLHLERVLHKFYEPGRNIPHFFQKRTQVRGRADDKNDITMIEVAMHSPLRLILFCALLLPLLSGCKNTPTPNDPAYVDAVEVKLKCRELADQMLATMPNDALQGFVAMPTSFVDQNNTSRSSPLGRLMGEALFYEFNQRGFPTREYRLTGHISVEGGRDDLALAANQIVPTKGQKWAALVVGTYYVDKDATFVNARLVRAWYCARASSCWSIRRLSRGWAKPIPRPWRPNRLPRRRKTNAAACIPRCILRPVPSAAAAFPSNKANNAGNAMRHLFLFSFAVWLAACPPAVALGQSLSAYDSPSQGASSFGQGPDISATYLKEAREYRKQGRYELARQSYAQALSTCRSNANLNIIKRELAGVELLLRTMR